MKNGKSPGSDGLPKEFYSTFFKYFWSGFVEMVNSCMKEEICPSSMRLATITLLCKDATKADCFGA